MRLSESVTIGEIFTVEVRNDSVKTKLQDILDDVSFIVLQPTIKGVPLRAEKDEQFKFSFARSTGIYMFQAVMAEAYLKDGVRLCRFVAVSELSKAQRRQFYRLPIVLNAVINRRSEENDTRQYKAKTVNLSEKSVLLTSFKTFVPGEQVFVTLKLTETSTVTLSASVYRCEKPDKKGDPHSIVLLFENQTEKDKNFISKYIFKQQVIMRKKELDTDNDNGGV